MNDIKVQSSIPVENPAATPNDGMDAALATLQAQKDAWVACSIDERIALIDQLVKDIHALAALIVETEIQCKGAVGNDFSYITEQFSVQIILHTLNDLKQSLRDTQLHGAPRIPGGAYVRPNGQTAARVFPASWMDRIMLPGYSAEVWMEPGVTLASLPGTQAGAYREKNRPGKLALVLGAGNVNSVPFSDVLYKLFVEKRVVLLKMNPVNAAVGPAFAKGFRSLIEKGFLQIVYGGAAQGSYLCQHPAVDEIHITGSDKSFEAIVFGPGPDGVQRKAARTPLIGKPVTGELGCITPVILVPGPWTPDEMDYQTDRIVSWLGLNAGFACNTPHLIVTHSGWPLRQAFLDSLREKLARLPLTRAYYPGTQAIYQRFIGQHPEAEFFGKPYNERMPVEETLPWTLIPSVPSENPEDVCFTSEGFCGMLTETPIAAETVPAFLERAVDFLNQQVWGTLSAGMFVHPASLQSPEVAAAVDRAIEGLRYGSITINQPTPMAYAQPACVWGGFPGQPLEDIQSGAGWVHNTLMFGQPQKTVLRAPFMETPKTPILFHQAKTGRELVRRLVDMEVDPSLWKFLGLVYTAMRG